MNTIGNIKPYGFQMGSFSQLIDHSTIDDSNNEINDVTINELKPSQNKKIKINMFDLLWFINPNYCHNNQLEDNEAHIITVSYNIDFGNLRLDMFKFSNDSIFNNIIFKQSLIPLADGCIYPSSAFKICELITGDHDFTCIEQLLIKTNDQWQKERPIVNININNNKIKVSITNSKNNTYVYKFLEEYQIHGFMHCCEFSYKKGLELTGMSRIMKNIMENK